MRGLTDDAADLVATLLLIAVLSVALIAISLLAYLIWLVIAGLITYVRLQVYRAQLEADFDEVADSLGWGGNPDDPFFVAFGVDEFSSARNVNSFDWISGTVLGEEDDDYDA